MTKARNFLKSIPPVNIYKYFQTTTNCYSSIVKIIIANLVDKSQNFSVKLIGNPIQKESSFIFSQETNEETGLIIYNAMNQQVYSVSIPSKTKSMYVPLFGNKTGIYFYVIRGSTGIIGKGKIEIIN